MGITTRSHGTGSKTGSRLVERLNKDCGSVDKKISGFFLKFLFSSKPAQFRVAKITVGGFTDQLSQFC